METLNKKLVALMVVLCLITMPFPSYADDRADRQRAQSCQFAKSMGFLTAVGGLTVSIIPGAQPLVAAYAVAALGFKFYELYLGC
jgi:hypothetical protein